MKIKHLVVLLVVVVIASLTVVEWQKHRELTMPEGIIVGTVGRGTKVTSKQVDIKTNSEGLWVLDLLAKECNFKLDFNSGINIETIKVEDEEGMHYMYSLYGETYDEKYNKHRCIDSLNLHGFRRQDNEFYEFSKLSRKMLCKVKANPSTSPRTIYIDFWTGGDYFPQLRIKQEGK